MPKDIDELQGWDGVSMVAYKKWKVLWIEEEHIGHSDSVGIQEIFYCHDQAIVLDIQHLSFHFGTFQQ